MQGKRVYVAGPYSADNIIDVLRNIGRGIRAAEGLFAAGHYPFCPWFDHQFELHGEHDKKQYQEMSMAWLEVSEAVVLIGDWEKSNGVRREMRRAAELGIPIFQRAEDFLLWAEDME